MYKDKSKRRTVSSIVPYLPGTVHFRKAWVGSNWLRSGRWWFVYCMILIKATDCLNSLRAALLKWLHHMNHLRILLKCRFDSVSLGWGIRVCISATLKSKAPEDSHDSLFLFPIFHVCYTRTYCASSQGLVCHHLLNWNHYFRGSHSLGHKNDQIHKIQKLLESFMYKPVEAKCFLVHELSSELCPQLLAHHVIFQLLLEPWAWPWWPLCNSILLGSRQLLN